MAKKNRNRNKSRNTNTNRNTRQNVENLTEQNVDTLPAEDVDTLSAEDVDTIPAEDVEEILAEQEPAAEDAAEEKKELDLIDISAKDAEEQVEAVLDEDAEEAESDAGEEAEADFEEEAEADFEEEAEADIVEEDESDYEEEDESDYEEEDESDYEEEDESDYEEEDESDYVEEDESDYEEEDESDYEEEDESDYEEEDEDDIEEAAAQANTGKKRGTVLKQAETALKEAGSTVEGKITEAKERVEAVPRKTAKELEEKLNSMLSKERKEMQKWEKRRGVEILGVFAKHNFYVNGLTPEELRTTLEDLGPTYVKIGQIMSSRVDLLPERYCKELEKLRQNVQELDPRLARAAIEKETGREIDEIFSEFKDKPLGSASIGQAHYAVLKDGTKVVVKVQRPLIADMMHKDFDMLTKVAEAFNVVAEGMENDDKMDLVEVIDEFKKVTEEELDFRVEAGNTKFFKENCIQDETKITCPDVIEELTTERIFTMTFVDGYSVSEKDRIEEDGYDVNEIGRNIVENYVHQILDVGVFHADPHQGNIMVSHGIPVWIDFGMIGRITAGDINTIQSLVMSVMEKDAETLANSIMGMGAATAKTNRDKLIEDLDIYLDRYCNVTSLDDLDMSELFDEVMNLASKHAVKMPGRFTMLVRSVATIEGVIEQLCPSLNLFKIVSDKLMTRAKENFNLENEILKAGKDVLEMGKKTARIPVLASDVLKGIARGRMKVKLELTGYEELVSKGAGSIRSIVLAIFACVLFFGSCLLCLADLSPKAPGGMPAVAAMGIIFSIALGIHAIRNM